MPISPEFWENRRVLVTGHTGFKGSWLCMYLHLLGSKIRGFALEPPTNPSLYELADLHEIIESTIEDVRNYSALCDEIKTFSPDVIIHMAAQSVVLDSFANPLESYTTNVMGTVNLLESIRQSKSSCIVVNVTTDKCYKNEGLDVSFKETDPLGGHDPYSSSKACSELVTSAYRDSYFPPQAFETHHVAIASARAGNVIGGGDWTPKQLIPDTIKALESRDQVCLRHPQAIRPWQHVLDCLSGYLLLAEKLYDDPLTYSGAWNFGPTENDSITVSEVVEILARTWGADNIWKQDQASYDQEEPVLKLNASKSKKLLGWHTRLSVAQALEWITLWHKETDQGVSTRTICETQIRKYLEIR